MIYFELNYYKKNIKKVYEILCCNMQVMTFDHGFKNRTGPAGPTGELSGSVRFNEPFIVEPVLNRSNRQLNR